MTGRDDLIDRTEIGDPAAAPGGIPPHNERLDAAIDYVARGWAVFPCEPRAKRPLTAHGLKDATTDPATVREWWERWPPANVAICTGAERELFVVDIDGDEGRQSLEALEAEHGALPTTLTVRTGGGGEHLYFRWPDFDIRNSQSKLANKLDVRGEGGYVIAPPSVHATGNLYCWLDKLADVADAPAWLLDKLRDPAGPANDQPPAAGGKITAGRRHAALVSQAGKLQRAGVDHQTLRDALERYNENQCDPPKPAHEVRKLADDIAARYKAGAAKGGVHLRRFSDIEPEPIRWLWPGRIARGKLTMLAGNPGLGKSQLTASIAAIVSRGGAWPDGGEAERGSVIILNAEDDAADTIGPRLIAAGADTARVYSLDSVTEGRFPDGRESRRPFDLRDDVVRLREAVEQVGGASLIIIDPVTAYLGATDSHKNAEIRALLAPLSDLATEAGAAVLCVSHLNKGGGADALLRVMGSLAFVAAARAAWLVAKDPDDEALRLFLPLKNNIAKDGGSGLAFHVEGVNLQTGGGPIETPRIAWHAGAVHRTADEVMAASRGGDEGRGALEDAKGFLSELLADDPVPAKQIKAAAKDAGISGRTIERAKSSLGVKTSKDGYQGAWVWSLPATEPKDRHKDRQSQTLAAFEEVGGLRMDRAEEGQVSEVEL